MCVYVRIYICIHMYMFRYIYIWMKCIIYIYIYIYNYCILATSSCMVGNNFPVYRIWKKSCMSASKIIKPLLLLNWSFFHLIIKDLQSMFLFSCNKLRLLLFPVYKTVHRELFFFFCHWSKVCQVAGVGSG